MLWLWHNGEVREIYRLAPNTTTQASLREWVLRSSARRGALRVQPSDH